MNRRVGIGLGDETPALDVSDFTPQSPNAPSSPETARDLAESEGFRNRGARDATGHGVPAGRHSLTSN